MKIWIWRILMVLLALLIILPVSVSIELEPAIAKAKPQILAFLIVAVMFLAFAIHIVSQPERWVVERLGAYLKTWEPGLHFLIPIIDRVKAKETMADQMIEIFMDESKMVEFKDASGTVKVVVLLKIIDPIKATYNIKEWRKAVEEKADASTRKELALLTLDEANQKNEEISDSIIETVKTDIENWGLKLISDGVLITDIGPSQRIIEEREKVLIAEKEKQANILRGEGEAGKIKKIAEGLRDNPEAAAYALTQEALKNLNKATVVSVSGDGNISLPTKISALYESIKGGMSQKKEDKDE